jgi:hypothetical protein
METQTNILPQSSVVGITENPLAAIGNLDPSVPPLPEHKIEPRRTLLKSAVLAGAGGLRVLSPIPNFTPMGAMCLFGGGRMRLWQAIVLPMMVMMATDGVLSRMKGYPALYPGQPFVYASMLIYVLLGRMLCRGNSPLKIGLASLLGSVQFFLISNFGIWVTGDAKIYPHTAAGLMACYTAAIPFFRTGTLLGDLLYTGIFFGAYALVCRLMAAPKVRLAS